MSTDKKRLDVVAIYVSKFNYCLIYFLFSNLLFLNKTTYQSVKTEIKTSSMLTLMFQNKS